MVSFRASMAFVLCAALAAVPAFASRVHRAPTSGHSHTQGPHKTVKTTGKAGKSGRAGKSHALRGQQSIAPDRVTEIQQALIREHYLSGESNGNWDTATIAAMQKYQADQGWQTRLAPDARALKKLGLGPDYSGAINAKDSSFAAPPPTANIPAMQSAGFAAASGISR